MRADRVAIQRPDGQWVRVDRLRLDDAPDTFYVLKCVWEDLFSCKENRMRVGLEPLAVRSFKNTDPEFVHMKDALDVSRSTRQFNLLSVKQAVHAVKTPQKRAGARAGARLVFEHPLELPPYPTRPSVVTVLDDDDSDDDDDANDADDADAGTEAACALPSEPETQGGRYAVADRDVADTALEAHLLSMAVWKAAPMNTQRAARAGRLSDVTCDNIRRTVLRFVGWAASRGDTPIETLCARGLFVTVDGPLVMGFLGFLLYERKLKFASVFQYANHLAHAVDFVTRAEVSRDEREKCDQYAESLVAVARQLQSIAEFEPRRLRTVEELVAHGRYAPIGDILRKTMPFIRDACDAFDEDPCFETASRVRDAALMGMTAGDGMPNIRPGEIVEYRDGAAAGGCTSCPFQCEGNTLRVSDEYVAVRSVHHKTAGRSPDRRWKVSKSTHTGRALALLVEEAAPLLRDDGDDGTLFVHASGRRMTGKEAADTIRGIFASLGLPGLTSRSARYAMVTEACDANMEEADRDGMARIMGNSDRAWTQNYDRGIEERGAARGQAAYATLVASAVPEKTTLDPPTSGVVSDANDVSAIARAATAAAVAFAAPRAEATPTPFAFVMARELESGGFDAVARRIDAEFRLRKRRNPAENADRAKRLRDLLPPRGQGKPPVWDRRADATCAPYISQETFWSVSVDTRRALLSTMYSRNGEIGAVTTSGNLRWLFTRLTGTSWDRRIPGLAQRKRALTFDPPPHNTDEDRVASAEFQ